ncbi:MAG: arginine--tRNA ligase [Candidatus Omnitrophica bacterium]|nr:arginine--tRNA ligase [Candidatus Omnitrophota bacterium]
MKKNIQELLLDLIASALNECGFKEAEIYLDFPTDKRFGDFSTNIALKLAKLHKRNPREVATCIIDSINKNATAKEFIREIKAEGAGFINFYLSDDFYYEELKDILSRGAEALKVNLGKGKKILLEFVSANPTGSLSVAHARQAAVGDVLTSIMDFAGFKPKKEFYLNDKGNQINILGNSVDLRMRELAGEKIEFPETYYQGEYIYDIAKIAKEKEIAQKDLGDFAGNYILDIIKQELEDFGVKFDYWYSQKALEDSDKIKNVFEKLKDKGYLYESEGALWFKSTDFGDDKDRVVIKSDKSMTYLAPDIAYHEDKFRRGFELLINMWGPDHHGYINRLKASIQALGHDAGALSIIIVQLATIYRDGKPVQMSTRKGQYITLREVLDEVGKDAARFFFLMRKTSSHLDFDLDTAKKQSADNPVYYVQYAHARISSILRSSTVRTDKHADFTLLKEKEELALAKKIAQFTETINVCISTLDPYMLTVYLQELGQVFHKFYDLHRVLGADDALTKARLALIDATKIVLAAGLDLLGVSKPEKM